MKLRIQDNTLRLRLSQPDIDQLLDKGRVGGEMPLPMPRGASFSFRLSADDDVDTMQVAMSGTELMIKVNRKKATHWSTSDEVGLEAELNAGEGRSLFILIEKDFRCLIDRPGEDVEGLFDNPNAS